METTKPHRIELLSPAKDAETGIAAIRYGADAVYIGPEKFSARKAAGNSVSDIERVITYARKFNARVYAALNTILFDDELDAARRLIIDLYNAGIDALIVQDMSILEMDLPPVAIHASTQADNYNIDRIRFLGGTGIRRIVLARELCIEEIKSIREAVSCELEFFVHGALCVSMSGRCYMSAHAGGRSANRGECAQPCRKEWDLLNSVGKVISHGHLLSTKDLNHTGSIGELIDAGIDSFKIEGRLKDIHYVKNITAHYRKTIDSILENRPGIKKTSSGSVVYDFTPDPEKTFNRGFTGYFLHGRTGSVSSCSTPKFAGRKTAVVTAAYGKYFTVDSREHHHNGDGLSFTDKTGTITGIRVNRVDGDKIYPLEMNGIYAGAVLYRNHDALFEKKLDSSRTGRRLSVDIHLSMQGGDVVLALTDEDGNTASASASDVTFPSHSAAGSHNAVEQHLKKFGDTIFVPGIIKIDTGNDIFIRPGILNDLRRRAAASLEKKRLESYTFTSPPVSPSDHRYPADSIGPDHNVSNSLARRFYERHGVVKILPAYECGEYGNNFPVMRTKMCLKYENNMCPVYQGSAERESALLITDGKRKYRLEFNCSECMMYIYPE